MAKGDSRHEWLLKPLGKAMYVAPRSDWDWLQSEQRKLYRRSYDQPGYVFRKLWGLLTDLRNLRVAFSRVSRNRGRRTAGADGITVRMVQGEGVDAFVDQLRVDLRARLYAPSPVRRVRIPKPGQPGKLRPLGIPTVKDRVVQAAVKQVLEPIFEADFYPCSYGFRPGRRTHGALEHLRLLMRPAPFGPERKQRRLPYQWAIEGDIKGCFDNIDHHVLMNRVRRRIGDAKVNQLIVAFLKAGVVSEKQFARTDTGTPQGGVLSPLLANIALSAIEERYQRWVWPRHEPTLLSDEATIKIRASAFRSHDRARQPTFFPIRYADDFIILVSAPPGPEQFERAREAASQEKAALAEFLRESLHLELSETKTLVTPVTEPMRFLGHHVRVRVHPRLRRPMSAALIPRDRSQALREQIKHIFRSSTCCSSLEERLRLLNWLLRGWGQFYRHAGGALTVFASLDMYVWHTILRWLWKKHRPTSMKELRRRYVWRPPGRRSMKWCENGIMPFELARLCTEHFNLGWMKTPSFVRVCGEPGA